MFMTKQRQSVQVSVPASTSNLGSGFDTLGLALKLRNIYRIRRVSIPGVQYHSSAPDENLVGQKLAVSAARRFFQLTGVPSFGIAVQCRSKIPVGRGLGASAAIWVGIIAGLNALAGEPLQRSDVFQIVANEEGHPDNASPEVYGGFTVAGRVGKAYELMRFPVSPRFRFHLLIPDQKLSTEEARRILPKQYSRADCAHSLNRSAFITAAFASGQINRLHGWFDDRFHEPYRAKLLPWFRPVVKAAAKAGAIGGFLSGAGRGVVCVGLGANHEISREMARAGKGMKVISCSADNQGYQVSGQ
jgi:homoserine kinase